MTGFWEANRKALGRRTDPDSRRLAAALTVPGPDRGLRSRQGVVLPGWDTGGRPRSLVSAYDPQTEARRWASSVTGGTVAVFGGAGTAAAQALADQGTRLLFWVEPRLEVWQALFTWEDWTAWLARDEWIPVWGDAQAWGQSLLNRYHPLWDGAFRSLEWRSAVEGASVSWETFPRKARAVLDLLAADTSTQARFGERWYRNTLANLKRLQAGSVPGCPGARVVVAGAGPGLEDALGDPENRSWLRRRPETGDRLFATDTSLPALVQRGIVPDLVLCLDGQLPSYHHFVSPPPAVPLVADLASIPFLGRLAMPQVRFLSGHPFGAVVRRWFPELPVLDGSLGNVSGLGLSAAYALGAARVDAWGVGFAYRNGQAYARGTYVYDLAGRNTGRLTPWETRLGAACYGASGLERTRDPAGRALDTTPLLRDYRRRWDSAPRTAAPVRLAHDAAGPRWTEFSAGWKKRLAELPLPPPAVAFHGFVRGLPTDRRADWWALWPLALALHRQGIPEDGLPRAVVERALSFLQD